MSVDSKEVTAATMWAPPQWVGANSAQPAAPAEVSQFRRAMSDPLLLSALLLVALIFVVGFRHEISRAVGTAGEPIPSVPVLNHVVRVTPVLNLPRAVAPAAPPLPLHAPRDPFLPLSAPTATPATTPTATSTGHVATKPAESASLAVTSYRVRSGDSLWSIARRTLGASANEAAINTSWHRIYAVNRAVIGPNPSQVRVGSVLNLPSLP